MDRLKMTAHLYVLFFPLFINEILKKKNHLEILCYKALKKISPPCFMPLFLLCTCLIRLYIRMQATRFSNILMWSLKRRNIKMRLTKSWLCQTVLRCGQIYSCGPLISITIFFARVPNIIIARKGRRSNCCRCSVLDRVAFYSCSLLPAWDQHTNVVLFMFFAEKRIRYLFTGCGLPYCTINH